MSEHDNPLSSIEERLKQWQPAVDTSRREELLYEAGRLSVRRESRGTWTAVVAASLALVAGYAIASWQARETIRMAEENRAIQPVPPRSPGSGHEDKQLQQRPLVSRRLATSSYLAMTRSFAQNGEWDVTPQVPSRPADLAPSTTPLTPRSWLE